MDPVMKRSCVYLSPVWDYIIYDRTHLSTLLFHLSFFLLLPFSIIKDPSNSTKLTFLRHSFYRFHRSKCRMQFPNNILQGPFL